MPHVSCRLLAAKRRLELLKGHDMAAYLKEVSSAKSGRIQKLLAQTDGCLQELMKRLQAKRPQTAQILKTKARQTSSSSGELQSCSRAESRSLLTVPMSTTSVRDAAIVHVSRMSSGHGSC